MQIELKKNADGGKIAYSVENAKRDENLQASECESEAARMEAGGTPFRQRTQVAPAVLPR